MNETIIKQETKQVLLRTREKEGVANGPVSALADAVLALDTYLTTGGTAAGGDSKEATARLAKIEEALGKLDLPDAGAIDEVIAELRGQLASKDEAIAKLEQRLATLEEALGETKSPEETTAKRGRRG